MYTIGPSHRGRLYISTEPSPTKISTTYLCGLSSTVRKTGIEPELARISCGTMEGGRGIPRSLEPHTAVRAVICIAIHSSRMNRAAGDRTRAKRLPKDQAHFNSPPFANLATTTARRRMSGHNSRLSYFLIICEGIKAGVGS